MPHPPQELPYRTESYDDFVLSVGRLDRAKRHELLLEALAADSSLRCVIVGDGPDRSRLEEALNRAGVTGQFTYVSTAGGAFLEWLEGKSLPGVEVLRAK